MGRTRVGDYLLVDLQPITKSGNLVGRYSRVGATENGQDWNADLRGQLQGRQSARLCLQKPVISDRAGKSANSGGGDVGKPPSHAKSPARHPLGSPRLHIIYRHLKVRQEALIGQPLSAL